VWLVRNSLPRTPDQVSDQRVFADSTRSRLECAGHRRGGFMSHWDIPVPRAGRSGAAASWWFGRARAVLSPQPLRRDLRDPRS
jgi:hypothetical protein